MNRTDNQAGFTLIELMIVIAILGLLAAVLLPNIMGARDAAGETATQSTFLQLENACKTFQRKHGIFPPADLQYPESGHPLAKATEGWKTDNGKNTPIESLVAFVSLSRSGGADLSELGDKLCNTDSDSNGVELPLLHTKDRNEVADAWRTPIAYFTKFTLKKPQMIVSFDGTELEARAVAAGPGDKYQFLSAGKDGTFGTDDDLVWPEN